MQIVNQAICITLDMCMATPYLPTHCKNNGHQDTEKFTALTRAWERPSLRPQRRRHGSQANNDK